MAPRSQWCIATGRVCQRRKRGRNRTCLRRSIARECGRGRLDPSELAPGLQIGTVVIAAPVAQAVGAGARCGGEQAVVPGEARQRQLQDHLGGSLRPALRAPGGLEADVVAAHLDQDAGELWTYGVQRPVDALARRDHAIADIDARSGCSAWRAPARSGAGPIRGDARGELRMPEVGAQALAGRELGLRDEGLAVLVPAAAQPGERSLLCTADGGCRSIAFFCACGFRASCRRGGRRGAPGSTQRLDAGSRDAVATGRLLGL